MRKVTLLCLISLVFSFNAGCVNSRANVFQTGGSGSARTKDLKIKGNKNSKIYHLPHCPNYDDIAPKNVVWFKTHEEAQAAGYRMARNC